MSNIDIVLAVILGYGFYRGFTKGFIKEIASFFAIGLGIYGAINFSFYASEFLSETIKMDKQYIEIVAFALTMLVIMLGVGFLGKILTKLLEEAALGSLNRFFGGVLGSLKWVIIVGAFFIFMERANILKDDFKQKSVLYQPVKTIANWVYSSNFVKEIRDLKI